VARDAEADVRAGRGRCKRQQLHHAGVRALAARELSGAAHRAEDRHAEEVGQAVRLQGEPDEAGQHVVGGERMDGDGAEGEPVASRLGVAGSGAEVVSGEAGGAPEAEVDAVIAKGCRDAVNAYEGLRLAHQTIVAVVKATDAGQCVGVSKVSRECNVAGAYVDLSKAAQEWAAAFERIKEAKR